MEEHLWDLNPDPTMLIRPEPLMLSYFSLGGLNSVGQDPYSGERGRSQQKETDTWENTSISRT